MPSWIMWVKLGLMVMEMLKEREKGEGLTAEDIGLIAEEAERLDFIPNAEAVKQAAPHLGEIFEVLSKLLGGVQ